MKKFLSVFAAAVMVVTSAAQADTVKLSDLLAGGSLSIGDKTFDNFSYTASGNMPSATSVFVSTFIDGSGNLGLEFNGPFLDFADASGISSDAVIGYRVTSSGDPITGVFLGGAIGLDGTTNGFGSIIESFDGLDADDFDHDVLEVYNAAGTTPLVQDLVEFDSSYSSLQVFKDILLNGGQASGAVSVTVITQTFQQGPGGGGEPVIPEPAMLGTLALGALGLIRRR
jgi:MYXO-CTERM domain-containing protein